MDKEKGEGWAGEVGGKTEGQTKKPTPFLPEEMPNSPFCPKAQSAPGEGLALPSPSFLTAGTPDLAWPGAERDRP